MRESLVGQARSLSSGTMATICRQAGILPDHERRQYRHLDAVQDRFTEFCATSAAETWQDAWHEYLATDLTR